MVTPRQLVEAAVAAKLDLIAITDHDTMASVSEVVERGGEAGIAVVAGQEITTAAPAQAHILGWFLTGPVRRGMSVADTVDAIHDQGGLAIIPHPFMPTYFGSIQPAALSRLIETRKFDGLETMSTVPMGARRRKLLADFYSAHRDRLGASVGSSDCHFGGHDIASIVTTYEGDFRTAIENQAAKPVRLRKASVPVRVALRQQWRALVGLPVRRLGREL